MARAGRRRANHRRLSVLPAILTVRHEMPSRSSDWAARQPHAHGWARTDRCR
jgi:hypothetical protein